MRSNISGLAAMDAVAHDDVLLITDMDEGASKQVSVRKLLHDAIYGMDFNVIVKCTHCGQWGGVKTECRKCGAPIDPPRD